MFALFLIALLVAIGVMSVLVLADSGLRWWSAFGQLRRELASAHSGVGALPRLRSDAVSVRVRTRRVSRRSAISRAAA